MNIEVDSQDVIKIVLQFLKENNLHHSMKALQRETNVTLNVVNDLDQLMADIEHGKWKSVLEVTSSVGLSSSTAFDLFEQMLFELIELNELDAARSLLLHSEPLQSMKEDEVHRIRYSRLDQLVMNAESGQFAVSDLYGMGWSKETKRKQIAECVEKEVFEAAPSRLQSLISDALKFQQIAGELEKGQSADLFADRERDRERGAEARRSRRDRNEKIVRKNTLVIPFGKQSDLTVIAFSPDGNLLVSGASDGFIECWDYDKGALMKDSNLLAFQSNDELLVHGDNVPVRCIAFSNHSQLMASGGDRGTIKIWKIYDGLNVVTFGGAHQNAVTSLMFNKNGSQILSSSVDGLVKIHGLRSGRTLKVFNGHSSFVNTALYIDGDQSIVSCSADGTVRIWNTKTTDCRHCIEEIHKMTPQNAVDPMKRYLNDQYGDVSARSKGDGGGEGTERTSGKISIRTMMANPASAQSKEEEVYVILSSHSHIVYLLDTKRGTLSNKIDSQKLKQFLVNKRERAKAEGGDPEIDHYFMDIAASSYGNYLYVLGEPDHILYCFNTMKKSKKGKGKKADLLSNAIKIHDAEVSCIAHHPHRNILASISKDRKLKIWRP